MSHDHKKKHHHHDEAGKKKPHHKKHDEGDLSNAIKNKHIGGESDDDDEVTPGFDAQQVTADSPKNVDGDVVAVMQKGQLCEVVANVGTDQGIVEGMSAYLLANDHTHYAFSITDVRPGATKGYVETTEEFIQFHSTMRVVFNPG